MKWQRNWLSGLMKLWYMHVNKKRQPKKEFFILFRLFLYARGLFNMRDIICHLPVQVPVVFLYPSEE